jgi:hypothetical protein
MTALHSKSPRVPKAEHVVAGKADLVKLFADMLDAAPLADAHGARIALSLTIEKEAAYHNVTRTAEVRKG